MVESDKNLEADLKHAGHLRKNIFASFQKSLCLICQLIVPRPLGLTRSSLSDQNAVESPQKYYVAN